jgi:uncharacterized protein YbbC (DUF1343 family)
MKFLWIILLSFLFLQGCAQKSNFTPPKKVQYGDQRTRHYFPKLLHKKTAILANHTSIIDGIHLLDTLLRSKINVIKVFSPEHGFRGNAGAGELVKSNIDNQTGIPIISLYGKHKKPSREDLKDVEILVFDIQDVGVRFYTYISTLGLVMEACAENHIPVIVLDRPNPHDGYIDGPVLDLKFKSFVGMYPIPVVYGLTIGELAQMINGEGWLKNGIQCDLTIIKNQNYSHSIECPVKVAPSPNLPCMTSIKLYPSLCFFEGTPISIGRGTASPFQMYGSPDFCGGDTTFTPVPIRGVAKHPKYEGKLCKGFDLSDSANIQVQKGKINLRWLLTSYQQYDSTKAFFTPFFDLLAGTDQLKNQIISGLSEAQIRDLWKPKLKKYNQIRKKYLLYQDNK